MGRVQNLWPAGPRVNPLAGMEGPQDSRAPALILPPFSPMEQKGAHGGARARLAGCRLLWHSNEMTLQKRREQARRVLAALAARYPEPASHLVYHNPGELLVATVLAAQ